MLQKLQSFWIKIFLIKNMPLLRPLQILLMVLVEKSNFNRQVGFVLSFLNLAGNGHFELFYYTALYVCHKMALAVNSRKSGTI